MLIEEEDEDILNSEKVREENDFESKSS